MCFRFYFRIYKQIDLLILRIYKILYVFEVMFTRLALRVNNSARIQRQAVCSFAVKYVKINEGLKD